MLFIDSNEPVFLEHGSEPVFHILSRDSSRQMSEQANAQMPSEMRIERELRIEMYAERAAAGLPIFEGLP